jgi:hypothetical protein
MKERSVHRDVVLPAHHQAAKISKPGKRPLNLPPPFIAPPLPPVLHRRFLAILSMRTNRPPSGHTRAQRLRIAGFVIDQPLGSLPRPPSPLPRHRDGFQRRLHQLHFCWGRRCQEVSQRNTFALDHHHPLRAFAPCGFPDAGPPFLAGAKLPSAQAADQSSWPWASHGLRRARQALSQTSCSSQSRRRRQQVLGEGYCLGSSTGLPCAKPTECLQNRGGWP